MRRSLLSILFCLFAAGYVPAASAPPPLPSGPAILPPAPGSSLIRPGWDVNQFLRQMGPSAPDAGALPATRPQQPGASAPAESPSFREGARLPGNTEFERLLKEALRDGRLEDSEELFLGSKAQDLGIADADARSMIDKARARQEQLATYFEAQVKALSRNGEIAEDDLRFLVLRSRDMGLTDPEAAQFVQRAIDRGRKTSVYQSYVEAFLEDGILDAPEQKVLDAKRVEFGLSKKDHADLVEQLRKEAKGQARDVLREIRQRELAAEQPAKELEPYGREIFQGVPGAFTPPSGLPPPDGYVLGQGDRLQLSMWGRMEADYTLVVDAEGNVQFPRIGPVRVGGLSFGEARRLLRSKAEAITGVSASVSMSDMRSVQIFVVGEAVRPGSVTLPALSTAVHAIMAAGGPTPLGSLRQVLLRRGGRVIAVLDVYEFLRRGEAKGDRILQTGDVLVLPKAERRIWLSGKVKRPAVYELLPGEGLKALLEIAGGLAPEANGGRIQVERAERNQDRVVLDVPFTTLKGELALQDGDKVRVFPLNPEVKNEVTLHGHVLQGGTYAFKPGMRVSDVVGSTENLKPEVELSYAVVLRESGPDRGRVVLPFRLGAALDGSNAKENLGLQPRDEIYVFSRENFRPPLQARATGEIRSPGLYRFDQGARIADLVRLAGGLSADALLAQAEFLRYLPDRSRQTLYVDLRRALAGDVAQNLELSDEDELVVHPVSSRRQPEVAFVQGEVNGRPDSGDRLSPKQKDKEAGDAERQGKTFRERFKERNGETEGEGKRQEEREQDAGLAVSLTRGMTVRDLIFKAGGLTKDAYLPEAHLYRTNRDTKEVTILAFHLGDAVAGDPVANLALQDMDHVIIHSSFEFAPSQKVFASGEVNRVSAYPYATNMRVRDLILLAGGLREDAFREEAEIVRTEVVGGKSADTRMLRFPLGRAMGGDPEANVPLKPYDRVLVKRIPDAKDARRIELKGEVVFPGSYFVGKGEKLSSVLERAGGFTSEAYVQGAVFTRESTRAQQQERLNEMRERLQQALLRASSQEAKGALSPEDVAAQKQYLESQQALLKKLDQTKATGRVVVRVAPPSRLRGSEWDVAVEDGDTLTVPKMPQTVTVVGQVYNPTSLLFEPKNRSVEHYLGKTGGPTADAEKGEIYVVRADGTVVSPQSLKMASWWASGISKLELDPGDSILVPEKVVRTSYMKEFKDITQILYQIAVTAGVAVALF